MYHPKGNPVWYDGDGNITETFSKNFKLNKSVYKYFSTIKRKKNSTHRFTSYIEEGLENYLIYVNKGYSSFDGLRKRQLSGEITFECD
ncbi:MAG: hypothetical protein NC548_40555 [Lachnospiraceae bacterium]|nr:hypothetical protein [Lachnospiraceae bacterium]